MDMETLHTSREAAARASSPTATRGALLLAFVVAIVAVAVVLLGGSARGPPRSAAPRAPAHGPRRARTRAPRRLERGGVRSGPPGQRGRADSHVPRDRRAARRRAVPGPVRHAGEFAEQMQALKSAGWSAVTLDQLHAYWREGVSLRAANRSC